ncbi:E3 ubiquitin-protein ligase TRIM56-like [Saccostrea echinata]|uniref:E3 ubiquitin-protein ligase TRIM56-like n=1 Tax=Saccostrea echinata TaxID=191078 RepID=UPI002A7EF68B|nr:E3 ubiquitin-protein ligase TRIM56-like [Saccostrea echinata]
MEDDKIERLRERILQCPICMDEYKDPRILPCHHTVCLNCLLDYVRHSSSSGRLFRCPQCRSDICVPRGGVKDFPPNFYVNCIQDELGSRPYFGICDICERDWLISQYRCVDCDLDICRFCIHEHRLFKHDAGRDVTIMRIETGNITSYMASEKGCENHSGEALQMFCSTCEVAVCVTCVCETHKKHETMPLIKKLMASQKALQFDLDDLKTEVKLTQDSLVELRNLRTKIQEKSDSTMTSIRLRARELAIEMDKMAELKIEKVRDTTGKVLQDIDSYIKELELLHNQARKGCGFLEDLQEDDVSLELFTCFTKYKKGLEVVRKSALDKTIRTQIPSFEAGKVWQYFGYHFLRFGDLKFVKEKAIFLEQERERRFAGTSKCRKLYSVIRIGLYLLFFLLIISGLCILTNNLWTSDHLCLDRIVGWLFFLHLTITGAFAFYKSR